MDRIIKIVLIALSILMALNLLFSIFGVNKNLNDVLKKLSESQKKIDESIDKINTSKAKIDSLQADLSRFRFYVKDIQGRVEVLDLEIKLKDNLYNSKRDSIKQRIKELKKDIPITGEDLPDIPTIE